MRTSHVCNSILIIFCQLLNNLSISQPFRDNVIEGIILGGLPDQFKSLILGIQGSCQDTKVEFVKTLLPQDNVKNLVVIPTDSALAVSKIPRHGNVFVVMNVMDLVTKAQIVTKDSF